MRSDQTHRCAWCGTDSLYVHYHDTEWGVPERDSKALFAKLILDGAQAGLSWITILRKRDAYYELFEGLDPHRMAMFDETDVLRFMQDARIVRNKAKITAAIGNAKAYVAYEREHGEGSFSRFLWSFVAHKPIQHERETMRDIPTSSPEAEAMSKALKKLGFRFVGPTIVYAFMQAVGMVNDHVVSCFRYKPILELTHSSV